jgi:hypothetical protein
MWQVAPLMGSLKANQIEEWMRMMLEGSIDRLLVPFNIAILSAFAIETSSWKMSCSTQKVTLKLSISGSQLASLTTRKLRYSAVLPRIWHLKLLPRRNFVGHQQTFGLQEFYYLPFSVDASRSEVKMTRISTKR